MELPFLGQLATQGVLGVLLALSLFVNYLLFRIIQDLNEKRINDAKEITTKFFEPIENIKKNGETLITMFNQFLNAIPASRRRK